VPGTDIQELIKSFNKSLEVFKDQQAKILSNEESIQEIFRKIVVMTEKLNHYSQIHQVTTLRGNKNPIVFSSEETAKRFVELFKAMFADNADKVKTLTEGSDPDGGLTVHPEFSTTIIRLINLYSFLRQYARVVPMSTMTQHHTTLASGITTYWVDENDQITASSPTFGRTTLTAKKLCALIPASNEFQADTTMALASFLASIVAEAFGKEEDRVGLVGNTANGDPFDGIIHNANVPVLYMGSGETGFTNLHTDDGLDMQGEVDASIRGNSRYVCEFSVESVLRELKESGTGAYVYGDPQSDASGVLWGRPLHTHTVMPNVSDAASDSDINALGFLIYGDFNFFLLGDRETMSIKQSDHVYFAKDLTAWRFKRRVAMALAKADKAFCILKTSRV
jgi:HK97 family phage major capsid protein